MVITETELLKLLDKGMDSFKICSSLFHPQANNPIPLKILNIQ